MLFLRPRGPLTWEYGFRGVATSGRLSRAARHAGQLSGVRGFSGRGVGLRWARGVAADGQCRLAHTNMKTITTSSVSAQPSGLAISTSLTSRSGEDELRQG